MRGKIKPSPPIRLSRSGNLTMDQAVLQFFKTGYSISYLANKYTEDKSVIEAIIRKAISR